MKRSKRELKAMAFAIADEAETRARQLMAKTPNLTFIDALNKAMEIMTERLENGH
jgi:hypothetical protein